MNRLPPFQLELRPPLAVVFGCADYQELRAQLIQIDHLIMESGLENELVAKALDVWTKQTEKPDHTRTERQCFEKQRANKRMHLHRALRCNIASKLIGGSFRALSVRLADSSLLQWFIQVGEIDGARPPSKSTLERYEKEFKAPVIEQAVRDLVQSVCTPKGAQNLLGLDQPLRADDIFMDTTCVKANIHFPVDWVLLRDATRTLIDAILNIRLHGLKSRIPAPASMMNTCNRLCIRITHSRRKKGGKKHRKAAFRELKKLAATVGWHGQKYLDMLKENYAETDLSKAEADLIIKRIQNILGQLPEAIRQAHERIIGERLVPNAEKILSLYEKDIHVLVRGKADAEVEFGSGLFLAEQGDGLIVDWELMRNQPPADSQLFKRRMKILKKNYGDINAVATDRGFHSLVNAQFLERYQIYNAICPKDPRELEERVKDPRFMKLQKRRGQTEGRIAIFKNVFLGGKMLSKGFNHRRITVAWCVLTHDLWALARLAAAAAKLKAA